MDEFTQPVAELFDHPCTEEKQPNGEMNGSDRISKLPQLADPHPNFPAFSSALSVRHEKSRGRYCVASRRIEARAVSILNIEES